MAAIDALLLQETGKNKSQVEGNNAVRAQLSGLGDDGTAERHVIHYFFAKRFSLKKARRQEIIDYVVELGFTVQDSTKNCVMFDNHSTVVGDAFDALTEQLHAFGVANGWNYDGWECAVVGLEDDAA